jgi:hypothetical protein
MFAGELPHEVVVSIQRILEIQPTEEVDRLDGLSERFNAVEILNDFFPDGSSRVLSSVCAEYFVQKRRFFMLKLSAHAF